METVRLARQAMGTRFELVLAGRSARYLHAAGEEALREVARLEAQLSLYRPDSDLSDLNRRAGREAVSVDPRLFRLLDRAKTLSELTEGAFDCTIAPLVRCWGFMGSGGKWPTAPDVEAARRLVGMRYVLLDAANMTVQFTQPGVMLDLGAIGKGYAVEQAVLLLQANEIECALLHGGTSTVGALGTPPGEHELQTGWPVTIAVPPGTNKAIAASTLYLANASLSVSAPHGKSFVHEEQRYGHVLDPMTGYPAVGGLLAAVVTPSATEGDALSTALLTRPSLLPVLWRNFPGLRARVLLEGNEDGEETGVRSVNWPV